MSNAAGAPYQGHFVPWDGGCLLIGRGGSVVPMHAHYAIQIAFGSVPGIRFRTGEGEPWTEYGGAIIASRQPHSMDATHVSPNAVLFVEPETREGRALAERHLRDGITQVPNDVLVDLVPALFAVWDGARQGRHTERDVADAARRIVQALTGGVLPSVTSDERILRAIAYIRTNLDRPLTLDEVAGEACLSPGRFRHLFVEQTGLAFKTYLLWLRLMHAVRIYSETSGSLTEAAHSAGFADSAHFSRVFKRTFGSPATTLPRF